MGRMREIDDDSCPVYLVATIDLLSAVNLLAHRRFFCLHVADSIDVIVHS